MSSQQSRPRQLGRLLWMGSPREPAVLLKAVKWGKNFSKGAAFTLLLTFKRLPGQVGCSLENTFSIWQGRLLKVLPTSFVESKVTHHKMWLSGRIPTGSACGLHSAGSKDVYLVFAWERWHFALAGVAQLIDHCPMHRKVTILIPSQGTPQVAIPSRR